MRNSLGKVVTESVIETKASTILQFIDGLRGDLRVAFEEGTWAAWLYDLLKPHVTEVLVCNTRKNTQDGSKSDRIDARKLSEMLYMNNIKSVFVPSGLPRSTNLECTGRRSFTTSGSMRCECCAWECGASC